MYTDMPEYRAVQELIEKLGRNGLSKFEDMIELEAHGVLSDQRRQGKRADYSTAYQKAVARIHDWVFEESDFVIGISTMDDLRADMERWLDAFEALRPSCLWAKTLRYVARERGV